MTGRLRRLLRRDTTTVCRCGHDRGRHTHFHDLDYCGTCPCQRYRPTRRPGPEPPVDLDAVCADHAVIEAVLDDRIDDARKIADDEFIVELVIHLKALRGAA